MGLPAILDDVQNVPEVFAYVRARIDRAPRRTGQWLLTGSQESGLMGRVTESLAGRAAVLQLRPISARESMSVPSVGRWLDILEATLQVLLVPPWFENLGKRLIKSPRVDIADSGLACHLLGIRTRTELARSPFLGALFEGFVAAEIAKARVNAGLRRELYHFRDQQGLEVDFVVPGTGGGIHLVEAKASATVTPAMAGPMRRLAQAWARAPGTRGPVRMTLVHWPTRARPASTAVAPGVRAMPWPSFTVGPLA